MKVRGNFILTITFPHTSGEVDFQWNTQPQLHSPHGWSLKCIRGNHNSCGKVTSFLSQSYLSMCQAFRHNTILQHCRDVVKCYRSYRRMPLIESNETARKCKEHRALKIYQEHFSLIHSRSPLTALMLNSGQIISPNLR